MQYIHTESCRTTFVEVTPRTDSVLVPEIEGMRAVAVVLVCLFHYQLWSTGGFIGVDVFFVVSGYLITGLIIRELSETGTLSLAGFYARRARRILPAACLVLMFTLIASVVIFEPTMTAQDGKDALWSAFFGENIHNILLSPAERASFGLARHYWSLSVEEQFYLAWPLLLVAAWKVWPHRRVAGPMAAAASIVVLSFLYGASSDTNVPRLYFSTVARAWELAAGGLFCMVVSWRGLPWLRALLGWVGLVAILRAAATYTPWTAVPGWPTLVPVVGTLAVLASVGTRWGPRVVLTLPPLQWMGARSYGMYLWHWPLLVLLKYWVSTPSISTRTATLVVSALMAALMYKFVENPVRFAPSLIRSPARSLAIGAAMTACVVVSSIGLILVVG